MLKFREVNPLNVHGLRQVTTHCPPHFTLVHFDLQVSEKEITDWVWTNLSGRFYFGDFVEIDKEGRRQMNKVLAFEIASEATYFGLFIDQVNSRQGNTIW